MDPSCNEKSYIKLAQLQKALEKKSDIKIIEGILKKEGDINYAIPLDCPLRFSKPNLTGYSALHFAVKCKEQFMYLLNCGADFTRQNEASQTVLHMLMEKYKNVEEPLNDTLIDSVLLAHFATNNFSNPCNKDGLSHLHIACMTKNSRAVEFFLDNGISANSLVSVSSKFSAGFSPLHFAAKRTNTHVAEILLGHGANMHITDASGRIPLHILIERRMEMFDLKGSYMCKQEEFRKKLQVQIQENGKIINMLLENMSSDNECLDNVGLSNLHVACVLQDISVAEELADQVADLNHCINNDSKLWPGYTPLHFAAHFSISTVEMLMKKGANIEIQDSKGFTPLDICIERYKIEEIVHIMSLNAELNKLRFSDGETKLVSFISALADDSRFRKFMKNSVKNINMRIPMESALWPGYTPLHLAVLFAERPKLIFDDQKHHQQEMSRQIIRFCLGQGADLSIQDSKGRTPLHLAFRLNKKAVVEIIFRQTREIPDVSDEDNLSHLHIICSTLDAELKLKKFALNRSVVNEVYKGSTQVNSVNPGSAPLHVCLADPEVYYRSDFNIINTLLEHGADSSIRDAYGLTPIHWLMNVDSSRRSKPLAKKMLKETDDDCVVEEYGISYLHVACISDYHTAVKHFLDNGADVNLAMKYTKQHENDPFSFFSLYDKYTPLHFVSFPFTDTMAKLLVNHGANVFAENAHGLMPISDPNVLDNFMTKLWDDFELQNRMRTEFGWTKLHIACYYLKKVKRFRNVVRAESADINAQVSSNSPIWKGYTPLHVFMCRGYCLDRKNDLMLKILLENGADVTKVNDDHNTPLSARIKHLGGRYHNNGRQQAAVLLKHHTNFVVNPVNSQGISHFHIACYLNADDAVKGFLSNGADVNHPIDFFSDWYPGSTSLHLVSKLTVIELLINHGANIHAEDGNGSTPLHKAVELNCFYEDVIATIIKSGAEINRPNFYGKTPFEIAVSVGDMTVEKLEFFIRQGFLVNSCNPITGVGYISLVLEKYVRNDYLRKTFAEMMTKEKSSNILGRTTLHNLVTCRTSVSLSEYNDLFQKLIKAGHDVDEQDNEGKTALHLAVKFNNNEAVEGLLNCGADINVFDINRNSAISYSKSMIRFNRDYFIEDTLTIHACRLILLKLDLNQIDTYNVNNAQKSIHDVATRANFFGQVALSKEIEVGVRSVHLYDFLSETGAVANYPYLNQEERLQIQKYFEDFGNDNGLSEIRCFLKLQYRKAVKRLELLSPAMESLRFLLGFNLPDLCAENLFKYLSNSNLKNVIRAGNETEDVPMNVD